MKRSACWSMALLLALTAGCVERRVHIESTPPGALVYCNGRPLGTSTPCDDYFIYYGKYRYTLVKDGYETLVIDEDLRAPYYEIPPIDFFAESIFPWKIRDDRRLHYILQPITKDPPELIRDKALLLQARGRAIVGPNDGPNTVRVPPAAPLPVVTPGAPIVTPPPASGPVMIPSAGPPSPGQP